MEWKTNLDSSNNSIYWNEALNRNVKFITIYNIKKIPKSS